MELEQRFRLPAPPAQVWPAFGDVPMLVACLPGASLAGTPQDGAWPLRFAVRLGPIAASFAGKGSLTLDESASAGRFEGQAADQKTQSRVKGAAAFTLAEDGAGGTEVVVRIDYALTGTLAQFGRAGIVKELAGALTAQFAQALQARIAAMPQPAPGSAADDATITPAGSGAAGECAASPATTAAATATPDPAGAAAAPLSLGALLWAALRARLARLFGRIGPKQP